MSSGGVGSLAVALVQIANYPGAESPALHAKLTQSAYKEPARVASAASIANLASVLLTNFDGATQGVTLSIANGGDRVLVKDTASPDGVIGLSGAYNGWYVVQPGADATHGKLVRDLDADATTKINSGAETYVSEGAGAGQTYQLTTANPITVGTTALTFSSSGTAGGAPTYNGGVQVIQDAGTMTAGTVTYTAGTGVTIRSTAKILVTRNNPDATAAHWGKLSVGTITPGGVGVGSVVINSSNAADASSVSLTIFG